MEKKGKKVKLTKAASYLYMAPNFPSPSIVISHSHYLFSVMEDEDKKELQLLPSPLTRISSRSSDSFPQRYRSATAATAMAAAATMGDQYEGPSLDLQLSISLRSIQQSSNCVIKGPVCDFREAETGVESLKWQATEQIRLAAIEKAYAERVRELTKREVEMAQSEFARARHMWQRAREEVEKAERLKERATRQIDSTCMEITCQSCRQRFRP